tara:strand:+ start:2685 stop:2900 length:216 start_codon:yes stop_codon:yes gene_type:complete
MTKLQQEQESVSSQVDVIMKNRERRFKFLMNKDRTLDAIAVGEEFMEWMMLDQEDCTEEILYFRIEDLQEA